MLNTNIVASNVDIHIKLLKAFRFKDAVKELLSRRRTNLSVPWGIAEADDEYTFRYKFKNVVKVKQMKDVDLT